VFINRDSPVLDYDGRQVVIDGAPQTLFFLIAGALSPAFADDASETMERREMLLAKVMDAPELELTDDECAFIIERASRAEYEALPFGRLREALGMA
jgi:hypothetical protein